MYSPCQLDLQKYFFAPTIRLMNTTDAVTFFGSKARIAEVLGISRQAVSNWRDRVPLRAALLLEQASFGHLKAEMPKLPAARVD